VYVAAFYRFCLFDFFITAEESRFTTIGSHVSLVFTVGAISPIQGFKPTFFMGFGVQGLGELILN